MQNMLVQNSPQGAGLIEWLAILKELPAEGEMHIQHRTSAELQAKGHC